MGNGRAAPVVPEFPGDGGATGASGDPGADGEPGAHGHGGFLSCPADRKERILEALGDRWAREILLMLSDGPRSAQEIQVTNRMPQSTLYRKLHELAQIGLIGVQRSVISSDGKRVELYRSLLEELTVEMRGTRLRIDVRFRDLSSERLKELWRSVRAEVRHP
ncbi:MAG TPA: helix-turn-helix domain-containing protein [Thermoplasmata archaeon]|nr:helix-turn-helix domain-containing protein [Thermoplasmata archaeon]